MTVVNSEGLAICEGRGLTWSAPCGCQAWMEGTHALYWRIPNNEYSGVSECIYCGATWGIFDSQPPWTPWGGYYMSTGFNEPADPAEPAGMTINLPSIVMPLGPEVEG